MRRRSLNLASLLVLVTAVASAAEPVASPPAAVVESSLEPKFFSNLRQVTSDFVRAGEGYFSRDDRQIVYQAVTRDYPFYQIFTQALEGGVPRLVSTGRGRTTCAYFSPDGKSILYASSHLDPDMSATEEAERAKQAEAARTGQRPRYEWIFDPHTDLFVVDIHGGEPRQLTDTRGYDAEGSYSTDGKWIVFCSDRDGDPDLYIMSALGGEARQLTNTPGYDGGPFFSPDGEWVVFRSDRKEKDFLQIYVIRSDGTGERALTDNMGVNWAPYWHPTEPYIVWTGADHSNPTARPNYDLWLMRYEENDGQIEPGPITRLTDHPSADVLPVFSNDGKRLMWTASRGDGGTSQLWIADFALPSE